MSQVEQIARDSSVERIVVGLPLDLSGDETERCAVVRDIGRKLSERLGVPVDYLDERFTSVRAERLVRSSGFPKGERERKERIDSAAAALILQAWLDRPRST